MDFVRNVLLFLHLIGMASLLGGTLVQLGKKDRLVNTAMEHGAGTQVVTGILLVGTAYMVDDDDTADIDNVKIAVKALVAIAVLVICLANRKRPTVRERTFFAIFALTLINIAVAVFWL